MKNHPLDPDTLSRSLAILPGSHSDPEITFSPSDVALLLQKVTEERDTLLRSLAAATALLREYQRSSLSRRIEAFLDAEVARSRATLNEPSR